MTTDKIAMIQQLDYYFPFLIFFYGVIVNLALELPVFAKKSQYKAVKIRQQLKQHQHLAILALFVGGLWSLQNLWLS